MQHWTWGPEHSLSSICVHVSCGFLREAVLQISIFLLSPVSPVETQNILETLDENYVIGEHSRRLTTRAGGHKKKTGLKGDHSQIKTEKHRPGLHTHTRNLTGQLVYFSIS